MRKQLEASVRFLVAAVVWASAAELSVALAAPKTAPKLDEQPPVEGQWGYRPADGSTTAVNPPGFCWRPQKQLVAWQLEVGRGDDFGQLEYRAEGITLPVHCPPRTFPPGKYVWRYRGVDKAGNMTQWSQARRFVVPDEAVKMPMPTREELLARVPKRHPRLFVRPEDLPKLRQLAAGPMKDRYEQLVRRCEKLLKQPPPTAEPQKYPPGMKQGSEEWRVIWWGNRMYTIEALDSAATLAFTRLLGGKEEYGQLARRILMDCAKWDPKGATNYHYNDEAGMPYVYFFARTYTFVNDLLTEEERRQCREVIRFRGDEMYRHLCPRHLWQPYASHSNRAWHKLGEAAIAFLGEVEGADDWLWFAMNVFYNVYPVWCDDDGGWHEGVSYWSSYIGRFSYFADVMRSALQINAFEKPYFSQAGYYAMYLLPPGKKGGGFGDGAKRFRAENSVPLVSQLAAQAGNGHWQWYVEQMGGPQGVGGYIGFVRGSLPKVQSRPPEDLPTSRLFRGTGQAYLHHTLRNAADDVQITFKSSPFGTQSHGNEANNSFNLDAYGQKLLVSSGHYDLYGSEHHRNWVWSTRSVNNITVDGQGQLPRSALAKGQIVAFHTTPGLDAVAGEAGGAYLVPDKDGKYVSLLHRFTRTILFIKPELVVVYDRLIARQPSTYQYWLHAEKKFELTDQRDIRLEVADVRCHMSLLAPAGLSFTQTDQYDPNPRERIKDREWHLTFTTAQKTAEVEFVLLCRPHRASQQLPSAAELKAVKGGYVLTAALSNGQAVALLPTDDHTMLSAEGLTTKGKVVVSRRGKDGSAVQTLVVEPLTP